MSVASGSGTQEEYTRVGNQWVFADGTVLPVVSGAEGDPPTPGPGDPPTPPATDPPTPPTPPAPDPDPNKQQTFGADYVRELREEAARHRTEKQALKTQMEEQAARLAELEKANLTDGERLQRERDEAQAALAQTQTQLQERERNLLERSLRYEIGLAAVQQGVIDPEVATDLVFRRIEIGENGLPTTPIADAIKAVLVEKPYLVGTPAPPPAPGGDPTNPARPPAGSTLTADAVRKMSPQEINARWDEIEPLLTSGALNQTT